MDQQYLDLIREAWKGFLAVVAAGFIALAALMLKRVATNVVEAYKKSTISQTGDIREIVKAAVDPVNVELAGTRGDVRGIRRDMTLAAEAWSAAHEETTGAVTEQSKRIDKVEGEVEDLKKAQTIDREDVAKLKTEVVMLQRNQGQRSKDTELIEKLHPEKEEKGNG